MNASVERGRFFLPGPTEVHPDVLEAQVAPMIGHRGPAIEELMSRIQSGLKSIFVTSRPVIVSTSSATGLMEAAVRNGVPMGGTVLSLVNGAFSGRFAQIARDCGLAVDAWEVEWGDAHPAEELARRLSAGRYDAVTLTQSETSTGALQDMEAIAEVVTGHEGTVLLVDSVTGVGGVETRTDEWGIDFVVTGSQKALALPPGLAFGVASDAFLERARTVPNRGWYFDVVRLVEKLESNQTPATPAVSLMYAAELQLKRIHDEGIEARWQRHLDMQGRTIEWVEDMRSSRIEIEVFAREGKRSPTVTCVAMPDGVSAPGVVSEARSRGWVIGGGYGKLKENTIRIGHMGDHTIDELDDLLGQLREILI
jgi:predicted phosphoserine aminotransferase